MSEEKTTYVVINGSSRSERSAVDYVAHIVYGNPRLDVVEVGQHFVALCQFPAEQATQAEYTVGRMGSFPHGASSTQDEEVALARFGYLIRSYAPGTVVGLEDPSYAS